VDFLLDFLFTNKGDKNEKDKTYENCLINTDAAALTLYISKIFRWFAKDFGRGKKERIDFILRYLEKSDLEKVKKASVIKIKYLKYDWNLNE
jgi:hypothetical protein